MSGYVKEIERAFRDAFVAPFHWYEVGGQRLYPVYGNSGGVTSSIAAILMTDHKGPYLDKGEFGPMENNLVERDGGYWFNVRFTQADTYVSAMGKIRTAVTALEAKQEAKMEGK